MKKIPMWRRYLLFWGNDPDKDVEREFHFHLEMRTREFIDAGWDPEAARHEAQRRFGDMDAFRKECGFFDEKIESAVRWTEHWNQLKNDVVYSLRQLRRSPAFTIVTV